jgi:hypothetical protein
MEYPKGPASPTAVPYDVQSASRQPRSRRSLRLVSRAAAFLSFIVAGILIIVTVTEPKLTRAGELSSAQKTAYTTVSTIIATLLTALLVTQMKSLFLARIDDVLIPNILAGSRHGDTSALASKWQSILGVGSLFQNLRTENRTPSAILVLIGLITACITAGVTPTTATRRTVLPVTLPSGDPTVFARPWGADEVPDRQTHNQSSWLMSNGSIFYSWTGRGGSPAQDAFILSRGINILDPDVYAVVDEGTAIHPSAVGAPFELYAGSLEGPGRLRSVLDDFSSSVDEVSACVPVMVRNPFRCRKGGKMEFLEGNKLLRLQSEDGRCKVEKTVSGLEDVEMLKTWCTHDEIGQATIILGADFNYHQWLAVAVNDEDIPPYEVPDGYTYSVECEVDARQAFEYRTVTLRLTSTKETGTAYSRFVVAGEGCSPGHSSEITNTVLATAATACHLLLTEGIGNSGFFRTIQALTSRSGGYGLPAAESKRSPPWALAGSENALEDVFGVVGGLAVSRIGKNSSTVEADMRVTVSFTRMGSGRLFALVFAVPPLVVGVLFLVLLHGAQRFSAGFESTDVLHLVNLGAAVRGMACGQPVQPRE